MMHETLRRIEEILQDFDRPVPLHVPVFTGNEWTYLRHCLDTGWVSTAGEFVTRFESGLAMRTGVAHAVAMSSGTAALHIALLMAGAGPGDEVLLPPLTFVATANAVAYTGATPHFVDIAQDTLGVCPQALAAHLASIAMPDGAFCRNRNTGRRIAALVVVHMFGHPADMDGLAAVCDRFGIPLVEDAAEALGSLYHGTHVGGHGLCAALSFNGNKIVTTGGGGALLTNDPDIAHKARHLSTTAKLPHLWRYDHDAVAYNYRMPNINAALGCAQLEQLDVFVARKRALAQRYALALADIPEVRFLYEPTGSHSNYWLNGVAFTRLGAAARDAFLEAAHSAGILARPAWTLLCDLPMYRDCPRMDLPIARQAEQEIVSLPSSVSLAPDA